VCVGSKGCWSNEITNTFNGEKAAAAAELAKLNPNGAPHFVFIAFSLSLSLSPSHSHQLCPFVSLSLSLNAIFVYVWWHYN